MAWPRGTLGPRGRLGDPGAPHPCLKAAVYRAVQIQATGAEKMPATAAVAGRRSFPVKSQIVQALTACQAFAS